MSEFRAVTTASELEAMWSASDAGPVILFKHSQSCGVSLMVRELLAEGDVPAPVHEIVVQQQRALSNAVADRLAIRHESPQVLVIVKGAAVWHSSHSGVVPARIARAWHDAAASFTAAPTR